MKPPETKPEPSDAAAAKPPAEATKKAEGEQTAAQKYVFKILPANPKNSFDFEDVADK